jgi:hydrogenase maturation protein HypF
VYRLATENHLTGTITNTASGVSIEIQGPRKAIDNFLERLPGEAPPLALITNVLVSELPSAGDREFRIIASRTGETVHTLISPDVATCDDCLRELLDPADRRYRYPFINCTNCGPRFTITRNIPYDRPSTSMAVFPMCAACQAEYDDPLNRRFHAQPNACWDCGPKLKLSDGEGHVIQNGGDPLAAAIAELSAGQIIAIKGLGGFHLACDATNPNAVALLRERKRRVERPFAIMVPSLQVAQDWCYVSAPEASVLESVQHPIVLLRKKRADVVPDAVAPFNRDLGILLPYTPLHHLLFAEGQFKALVMTSGNLSEEPIAIDNDEARTRLSSIADHFLMHNREILLRCDDSVVRVVTNSSQPSDKAFSRRDREAGAGTAPRLQQLRRSRGFVPLPVFLNASVPPILAVGGELKSTICLTKDNHAFLSQHIGDLETLESYKFFEEAINHFQTILEVNREIIAYDLHPDYFSTKWALEQTGVKQVGVQHHHAHIASCMAENRVDGDVIGIALDGTGYGLDGNIWGGEVLIANYRAFQRAAHFEYVRMPGGAIAIREPWRMAVSYLVRHFGRDFLKFKLPLVNQAERGRIELVQQMIEGEVNSPLTSSCGRLFDAVAALAGIRYTVNYEAQAAVELEMSVPDSPPGDAYPFELSLENDTYIIGTRPLFEAVVHDLEKQTPPGIVSARFHNGLVELLVRIANLLRERSNLDSVCLSGGSFNNVYLTKNLCARLGIEKFQVYTHTQVPTGDGGLSLGQAMIATRA